MAEHMSMLQTIPFSELFMWDVKRFVKSSITSRYEIVTLGDFIFERNEKVKLYEFPDEAFGILGVNNKEGVFDAYTEFGKNINQAYKKVKNLDLTYNPYRVNVGSIGMRTLTHKNEYISPAYVVFECKPSLMPDFLYKIFKTDSFNAVINDNTTGSVRQNLKYETLEKIKVPLPPLSEQSRLIEEYNSGIVIAEQQEANACELENNINEYLIKTLGVKQAQEATKARGLNYTSYQEINRWDVPFLIGNIATLKSDYPTKKFSEVITNFNQGASGKTIRLDSTKYPDEDFYYIGMEHIEKETGNLLELNNVKGREIKSQTLRVPQGFLLYGKLRPYLNKYWYNETEYENIICSSEFFVFNIDNTIDKQFFKSVLASSFIQHQIADKTSGARMPRINESIFFNLQFPLPSPVLQKEIAKKILDIKSQIQSLRQAAEQNKKDAIKRFERAIFNQ